MTNQGKKTTPLIDDTTRHSYIRTRLSIERTMMSWVRTATSLITFGFAICTFFDYELNKGAQVEHLISPRAFGITMIVIGLISLLMGAEQHMMNMQQVRAQWPDAPRSVAVLLAALIAILGLGALAAAFFRQ